MLSIVARTCIFCCAISLFGCGVRGPLTIPTVPAAPNAPEKAEPQGKIWPPPAAPANDGSKGTAP